MGYHGRAWCAGSGSTCNRRGAALGCSHYGRRRRFHGRRRSRCYRLRRRSIDLPDNTASPCPLVRGGLRPVVAPLCNLGIDAAQAAGSRSRSAARRSNGIQRACRPNSPSCLCRSPEDGPPGPEHTARAKGTRRTGEPTDSPDNADRSAGDCEFADFCDSTNGCYGCPDCSDYSERCATACDGSANCNSGNTDANSTRHFPTPPVVEKGGPKTTLPQIAMPRSRRTAPRPGTPSHSAPRSDKLSCLLSIDDVQGARLS